jgi:hypothetical protein
MFYQSGKKNLNCKKKRGKSSKLTQNARLHCHINFNHPEKDTMREKQDD